MDFTATYRTLQHLADGHSIHNILKLKYHYQNVEISIWYTTNLPNELTISCIIPGSVFPFTILINSSGNQKNIDTYIDSSQYSKLRNCFQQVNPNGFNDSMNAFFQSLSRNCNADHVVEANDPDEFDHIRHINNDHPFFQCFVRTTFTQRAREKIIERYPSNGSAIIKFCESHNCSVRFTDKIQYAHDIIFAEHQF